MTKICPKCNENKPFTEYYAQKKSKDGYQYICISCSKQVSSAYYKATPEKDSLRHKRTMIRAELISNITTPLLSEGCIDCHKIFPTESMDFDHVSGDKIIGIRSLASSSYPNTELIHVLMEELKKCEVVCANCHRIRTINRYKTSARRDYYEGKMNSKMLSAKNLYVYDFISRHCCMDCNESDMRVLEMDHVRGQKINNIAYMITQTKAFSLEDIRAEIAKCEIVCVNCHRVRTRKVRKSLSSNRGMKITTGSNKCSCGNFKPAINATNCLECFSKIKGDLYNHLTTEEMVANVRLMGMKPYATILGLSDNGLKKILIRRGVSMPLRKDRRTK